MISPVELSQELRSTLGERSVDLEAGVRPASNPVAVVQVRLDSRAVARVRFMIAAARTERPGPAGRTVSLVRDVVLGKKIVLTRVIDAVEHGAQLVRVGAREAMAERDVSVGRHAHEAKSRAAGIGLAHAFVQLLERVAY